MNKVIRAERLNESCATKRGKPKYEPTAADRATVQNLAALGATHADIAKCIGTNGIDEKTLRKHFRRELDASLMEVKALAMSKVVAAIKRGEAWAVCFFLKCRPAGGRRRRLLIKRSTRMAIRQRTSWRSPSPIWAKKGRTASDKGYEASLRHAGRQTLEDFT